MIGAPVPLSCKVFSTRPGIASAASEPARARNPGEQKHRIDVVMVRTRLIGLIGSDSVTGGATGVLCDARSPAGRSHFGVKRARVVTEHGRVREGHVGSGNQPLLAGKR